MKCSHCPNMSLSVNLPTRYRFADCNHAQICLHLNGEIPRMEASRAPCLFALYSCAQNKRPKTVFSANFTHLWRHANTFRTHKALQDTISHITRIDMPSPLCSKALSMVALLCFLGSSAAQECFGDPELNEFFAVDEPTCCQQDVCGIPCPAGVTEPTKGEYGRLRYICRVNICGRGREKISC